MIHTWFPFAAHYVLLRQLQGELERDGANLENSLQFDKNFCYCQVCYGVRIVKDEVCHTNLL